MEINKFFAENPGKGFLTFQAFGADGAFPVKDAKVTVSYTIGEEFYVGKVVYTDENGKTEPISLPAPSKTASQTPGSTGKVYSVYNVVAEAKGFRKVHMYDVPVFDGVMSIQPINFTPNIHGKKEEESVKESEPADL